MNVTEQQALEALRSLEWLAIQSRMSNMAHMAAGTLRRYIHEAEAVKAQTQESK